MRFECPLNQQVAQRGGVPRLFAHVGCQLLSGSVAAGLEPAELWD